MIRGTHNTLRQDGFTLVEVMLALLIFSMILLMGYQAIVTVAQGQNRIAKEVDQQAALRAAHRTLANAVKSGASLTGTAQALSFDLQSASSNWLSGSSVLEFSLNTDGQLLVNDDVQVAPSTMLQSLSQARFEYHKAGLSYSQWQQTDKPDYLLLLWSSGETNNVWRFVFP